MSQEKIDLTKEDNKDPKLVRFGGHNYKADEEWTAAFGEKANGETQIKEFKYKTGTVEGMVESMVDKYIELYNYGKSKGLNMVSPLA